jgi:hypothetical protein
MTILVQKAIADMGTKCLGFTTPKECGTYLIQSTPAMPMAGVPVYNIMLSDSWGLATHS